jgi:hypothetical protein
MLRGFARAYENDRDVCAISVTQDCVVIDVHLAQRGTEFAEQRLDQGSCFVAKVATRTRVQRNRAGSASRKSLILWAIIQGFASLGKSRSSLSNRTGVISSRRMTRPISFPDRLQPRSRGSAPL